DLKISARSAAARKYSNVRRFSGVASAARTWTAVSMFSQMRGGGRRGGGRGQQRGGPELAEITLDGLRALGTVGTEAHEEAREERVDRVARPSHRQIGQRRVGGGGAWLLHEGPRHLGPGGVADHRALGIPGGAGGVADDRHVVGPALVDLRLEQTRTLGPELPAELLHVLVRLEPLVLIRGQPAGIVVDHEAQGRQLLVQGEYLF